MDKNVQHREIKVSTLWYHILKRWRLLLVIGLLFAVLGAGYKYRKSEAANAAAQEEASEAQKEEDSKENSDTSTYYDRIISQSQSRLEQLQAYLGETVLNKIDPANEAVAVNTYTIVKTGTTTFSPDYAAEELILKMENDLDWDAIAQTQNTQAQYINELVNFDIKTEESAGETTTESDENDYETTPLITVTVKHYNMDAAQEILDAIDEQIPQLFADLDVAGVYSVSLKDTSSSYQVDGSLISWTNTRLNELTSLKSNIERLQSEKDEYTSGTTASAVILSGSAIAKGCVKYAAAGFVGGVLLMMVLIALYLAVCGRVLSAEEADRVFGIRSLTVLPDAKPHRSALDRHFARLDVDGKNELTVQESWQLAVQNLRTYYPEGAGSILLTGDVPEETLRDVMESLKQAMGETDLQFTACGTIYRHPAAIAQLQESDAVILVGKIGGSRYRKIAADMEEIENRNKPVIGSIIL